MSDTCWLLGGLLALGVVWYIAGFLLGRREQ